MNVVVRSDSHQRAAAQLRTALTSVMCERFACDPAELADRENDLIQAVVNFDPDEGDAQEALTYVLSFLNQAVDVLNNTSDNPSPAHVLSRHNV